MLTRDQVKKFPLVYRLYCPEGGLIYRYFSTEQEMLDASLVLKFKETCYRETFHRAWVVRITGENLVKRLGGAVAASEQADHYYLTEKEAKRVASLWKLTGALAQVVTRDMWPNGDQVL
jgi:hypothetical protein